MNYSYYDKLINKKTTGRYDVNPLFKDPKVFSKLLTDLIKPFKSQKINKVVRLNALGFIIGAAMAERLKIRFVPVRKSGKLPGIKGTKVKTDFIDYTRTKKSVEMDKKSISKEDRVLIVDDWIETGAQMKAAIKLIEKLGGTVVGISVLRAHKNLKTNILFTKYDCHAIGILQE